MNSKYENAVQNTNTVSTSEERSQAHSPVVISRRRLLRAGVSGIPILLTMHGLAPAEGTIKGAPSAASAMNYDKQGTYQRMYDYRTGDVVYSDENGFIIYNGARKESDKGKCANVVPASTPSEVVLTDSTSNTKSFNVSTGSITAGWFSCYLHKSGNWYADLTMQGNDNKVYDLSAPALNADTSSYLASIIKELITVTPVESDPAFSGVTVSEVTITKIGIATDDSNADNVVTGSDYNNGTNYYYKIGENVTNISDTKVAAVTITCDLTCTKTVTDTSTDTQETHTYKNEGVQFTFDIVMSDTQIMSGTGQGATGGIPVNPPIPFP